MTDYMDEEDIKPSILDIELVKKNIPIYTSEKLCDMIVCSRYFGFNEEISILCMEELSNRRVNGDDFNFEFQIENSIKELPELNFKMPDLRSVLGNLVGKIK